MLVLTANQEVTMSAGAFQSLQLLMVSGVSPTEQSAQFDIPTIADRPGVGFNVWDHVVLSVGHQVDDETYSQPMDPILAVDAVSEYTVNQAGVLTNVQSDNLGWEKLSPSSCSELSSTAPNDLSQFADDWPEVEARNLLGTIWDTILCDTQ